MYYSDLLRGKISKRYSLNIEKYVWTNEFNKTVMNIEFNSSQKGLLRNMSDVYGYGFNIGYAGLTSKYYALNNPEAQLIRGYLPILKGTMYSINGLNIWIVENDYIIDFTLRIKVPISEADKIGYKKSIQIQDDKELFKSTPYPSYLIFDKKRLSEYQASLLKIVE
jgi:hypothetical protein